jgi:hypothetical protein
MLILANSTASKLRQTWGARDGEGQRDDDRRRTPTYPALRA